MLATFTFTFIAVPSMANSQKEMVNIYLRFTKGRIPRKFSVARCIPKECWSGKYPIWCENRNGFKKAQEVNLYLNILYGKGQRLKDDGENPDYLTFKKKVMGEKKPEHTLHNCMNGIEAKKKAKGRKDVTIGKDQTLYLKFITYLYNRKKAIKEDFNMKSPKDRNRLYAFGELQSVNELCEDTVAGYELYMRTTLQNEQPTIYKGLNYVRQLCKVAYRKKWIQENPFEHYKIEQGSSTPSYNTIEELAELFKLWKSGILKKRRSYLHNAIRRYLVRAFTGQHFTDSLNFRFDEIEERFGRKCFERLRVKNENPYFVPILKWGLEVIMADMEEGQEFVIAQQVSNTNDNLYIKEAMALIGSKKMVSSKAGRHSFSSFLYDYGIDEYTISIMLGHKRRSITQHYIHVNFQRIVQEMERIEIAIENAKIFE